MITTCKHCNSTFKGCDRNEDGQPEIETTRCGHPECEVRLCGDGCQKLSFVCADCTKRFCSAHPVFILGGDKFCGDCFAGLRQSMMSEAGCTLEETAAYYLAFLRGVA